MFFFLFVVNVLYNILGYNEEHKICLNTQKELGYVRKLPGDKNKENIRRIIEKLKSQSPVDKTFVSKTSTANQSFHERDIDEDKVEGTDGSTTVGNGQYMLMKMNFN